MNSRQCQFRCHEPRLFRWPLLPTLLLAATLAHAQSSCSSDGQPTPGALFERFINADCASCWTDPTTPAAPDDALQLDWIVPGSQGDEAALSAAASSDALTRLQVLQRVRPDTQSHRTSQIDAPPGVALRVAHGPAVGGYVGVAISLTLPQAASPVWPLSAWLVLMQALPSGAEGSVAPRNLVRNVLQPSWNKGEQLSNQEGWNFSELRAMSFPQSAHTDQLKVAGWVQDAQGRILAAAQSACPPEDKD